jgi:hypothetical protein
MRDIVPGNAARSFNPFEGFRVMKRRKLGQLVDRRHDARVNPDRGWETSAAMNYAVRHCVRGCRKLGEKSAQHLMRHELFTAEMIV